MTPDRQQAAMLHYQRHVLAWYALGRVQEARAAWAAVCDLRRRLADAESAVVAVVAVGVLLALASPAVAAPHPVGPPKTRWSLTMLTHGGGSLALGHDVTRARSLRKQFHLGHQGFTFDNPVFTDDALTFVRWRPGARDVLAQAPAIDPVRPLGSGNGSVAHLDVSQAYEKEAGSASLRISLDEVLLELDDANGPLSPFECPVVGTDPCPSLRSAVHVRVHAWEVAGGHELLNLGGTVYVEGHKDDWLPQAATDARSRGPFWEGARFDDTPTKDAEGSVDHIRLLSAGDTPIVLRVPLRSLANNELFEVRVTMDAEAIDDRGRESAAQAFLLDPPHAARMLSSRGLERRRVPTAKEPPVRPQPLARCPGGPRRQAGRLQLSSPAFSASEEGGTPMVLVTRTGGSRGAATVTIRTRGGSAQSGQDFKRTRTRVRFENGDSSPRLVEIPIREDLTPESPERFSVSLAHARCAKLGKRRKARVTILDDDQPPPPPPPVFTIGGTVDGLQGSGLVLSNLGQELPVSADGSFTLPGTHTSGELYDLSVKSQPRNPDQLCTVENGKGHVGSANVTNIAVHCATVAGPSGLDPTFGGDGRVSTPGVGEGRAVLIQPDGGIVTVGSREIGATFHFQFGATRHDAAGNLDPSFGSGGIATTSLGGDDDEPFDAALLDDGGFVAAGQIDPAGPANTDVGLVRYNADGKPNPDFGTGGIVTTDLAGRNDGANAVAVQPADGKIVTAGFVQTSPIEFDFALVRYNPDGTLDPSFGRGGIVTTDLGTQRDTATALAIQPDGKIVAVGSTETNIALARYNPDGTLDLTFDGDGKVVGDIHTNVANGVVITPDGTILVAGTRGADAIVASYSRSGTLNLGFGNLGVAEADPTGRGAFGQDLALDAHGNIVVVGSANSATVFDMALMRFTADGTLEKSITVDFEGFGDSGNALAIDSQGRIVAAGTDGNGFGLMRAFL